MWPVSAPFCSILVLGCFWGRFSEALEIGIRRFRIGHPSKSGFSPYARKGTFSAPFREALTLKLRLPGPSWAPLDRSGLPLGLPRGAFLPAWWPHGRHWSVMGASLPVQVPLLVPQGSILRCFGISFGVSFWTPWGEVCFACVCLLFKVLGSVELGLGLHGALQLLP